MTKKTKEDFLNQITANIKEHGHHVTIVNNDLEPRYAYTIGVKETLDLELVFAGGLFYMEKEVIQIINEIVSQLKTSKKYDSFEVGHFGSFKISKVHPSWTNLLMLGFFDYYKLNEVHAFQIIPDSKHITLDVPDLSLEWNPDMQPIWKWLTKSWDYPISQNSRVITNIEALKGEKITEIMRWEDNEWEAFAGAGPDVEKENIRIVSLGTMMTIDPTLEPMLILDINKGIWRNPIDLIWHEWN